MGKTFQALERYRKEFINNGARPRVDEPEGIHAGLTPGRHPRHITSGVDARLDAKSAEGRAGIAHAPLDHVRGGETAPENRTDIPARAPGRTAQAENDKEIHEHLVTLLSPHSFEAEQIKLLKAQILYRTAGVIPNPLAVTSALPGEGKSFIAANLAVSIAQELDRHVLLIDCDLRKPGIHTLFGFKNPPGLSDYLTHGTALQDLLLRTKERCLSILPAGALPPNPSELLSSKRMVDLLLEVSGRYRDRIIILDTPPVAMTAEGNTLVQFVEAVLLVVKHNGTPKEQLKDLVKRIGTGKILGAVLNNVDRYAQSYGQYRKYQRKYYGASEA